MYEAEAAELYDLVHRGRGNDYRAESSRVIEAIRSWKRDAASLLDVACGTGGHLRFFRECFKEVEGVDQSPDMLAHARRHLPGIRLNLGDMRSFALGRTFDAVTCLFSSIGHLATTDDLEVTLACFEAHIGPGGVVVVEPWWFPDTLPPGGVSGGIVESEGRTIARVAHSSLEENTNRLAFQYLVADSHKGIRHMSETTRITLFTRAEYERAFERAGLTPHYVGSSFPGRGLFVGVRHEMPVSLGHS